MSLVPSVLWSAGALFAISLALIVSGAVVVFVMCLFRLADLSQRWDGDAVGQLLLLRERTALTRNRELRSDLDADVVRLSDTFVHRLNEHSWSLQRLEHPQKFAGLPLAPERRGSCELTLMEGAAFAKKGETVGDSSNNNKSVVDWSRAQY
jgi:hypothetical protein